MNQKGNTIFYILIGVILLILIGGGAYYSGTKKLELLSQDAATIPQSPEVQSSQIPNPNNTSDVGVFNLNGGDASLKYFISQVTAPSTYFATDDNMIDSYTSQGGMAPPRIILMKGYQVNKEGPGGDIDYRSNINQTKNDCIVIWSTNGFSSIDDWNSNITSFTGTLTDTQEISIGQRKAQMYKMVRKEGDIYVGLLTIGNKDNTSYYFHTCNINNKLDFVSVIQSIKFRDDLYR